MKTDTARRRAWSSTVSLVIAVAILVLIVVAAVSSLLGIAYLVNGDEGISDNWVGAAGVVGIFTALALSAVNLVAALGHLRHLRTRPLLWLAVLELPVLLAALVILEIFVIE